MVPIPKGVGLGQDGGRGVAQASGPVLLSFPLGCLCPPQVHDAASCGLPTLSLLPSRWELPSAPGHGTRVQGPLPTWLPVSVLAAALKGSGTLHTETPLELQRW